jgi:hypothetical protein
VPWTKKASLIFIVPSRGRALAGLGEARIVSFSISDIVEKGDFDSTASRGNIRREFF